MIKQLNKTTPSDLRHCQAQDRRRRGAISLQPSRARQVGDSREPARVNDNPYGASKLMIERILADTAAAHPLGFAAPRYFNVAGADLAGRTGLSTPGATHLIKVIAEHLTGKRPVVEIFGSDFDTPDGTGVRDYIHVSNLADLHVRALDHLAGGARISLRAAAMATGYR